VDKDEGDHVPACAEHLLAGSSGREDRGDVGAVYALQVGAVKLRGDRNH